MEANAIFTNRALLAAITAWTLAQALKVFTTYWRSRKWDWVQLLRPGGMPSSHAALVCGLGHAVGLYWGFASPLYAIAFVLAMIVVYDAAGVRRQAGRHASIINKMIDDLAAGHPLKSEQLMEVLGHTPLEITGGIILGLAVAQAFYWIWP